MGAAAPSDRSGERSDAGARALLLLNPTARRAAQARRADVHAALAERWQLEVIEPRSVEAMRAALREARERSDIDAVLVAGGDGTLRLAAEALAGAAPPVGIVPCGTANDLSRALGLPRDALAAARRLAARAPARPLAMVDANGARFCSVGGLGLVTTAALTVPAWRAGGALARGVARASGSLVYRLAATAALLAEGGRVRRYAISWLTPEGARHDETFAAHGLFVASQRYLGGGLRLPAGARPDGAFVLCVVRAMPRARLLAAFTRLSLGLPVPEEALALLPAREAHVVAGTPDALFGDGDALGTGSIFHLRACPGALHVLA
ncbi:MAG TPA: diacylglycerol kinase family protein [Gemmatirosa sp.]|nr:diacylglycerol kinase family protein [Gemmatirosa sp.]